MVGVVKRARTSPGKPCCCMRSISVTASREWPPSSKKVVVPADALELQQFGPDGGHLFFQPRPRAASNTRVEKGAWSGVGKRFAVELAVGGERQIGRA